MTQPWIYVAGPYTGGDVCANVREAGLAAFKLRDAGAVPIVPHLSHFLHYLYPRPYEYWMDWDFALLAKCDALVRLAGVSSGADREVERAREMDIPVFYDVVTAIEWVYSWRVDSGEL